MLLPQHVMAYLECHKLSSNYISLDLNYENLNYTKQDSLFIS